MKQTGKTKEGRIWEIESEEDFVVITCPNCGEPLEVIPAVSEPFIIKFVFTIAGREVLMIPASGIVQGKIRCNNCGFNFLKNP